MPGLSWALSAALLVLCLVEEGSGFSSVSTPPPSPLLRGGRSACQPEGLPLARALRGAGRRQGMARQGAASPVPSEADADMVEGPFQGEFGVWYVSQHDALEVLVYRLSLVTAALSVAAGTGVALTSGDALALDACALTFLAAFGVSVKTIHIYMKPMHDFLKVLWGSGVAGSAAVLASAPSHHLVATTFEQPELLLASGWVFVALTGLFFKEFACFQRWEASALFAIVPVLTGGHFLHILPGGLEQALAVTLSAVFVFFAARKFTQPYKVIGRACGHVSGANQEHMRALKRGSKLSGLRGQALIRFVNQTRVADIGDKTVFDLMAKVKERQEA